MQGVVLKAVCAENEKCRKYNRPVAVYVSSDDGLTDLSVFNGVGERLTDGDEIRVGKYTLCVYEINCYPLEELIGAVHSKLLLKVDYNDLEMTFLKA